MSTLFGEMSSNQVHAVHGFSHVWVGDNVQRVGELVQQVGEAVQPSMLETSVHQAETATAVVFNRTVYS